MVMMLRQDADGRYPEPPTKPSLTFEPGMQMCSITKGYKIRVNE
jgi:hypothetical protein